MSRKMRRKRARQQARGEAKQAKQRGYIERLGRPTRFVVVHQSLCARLRT